MGVVNVTPDSFSDGGDFADREAAIAHGLRLAAEGADLIDVGGESTRPGAAHVPLEEELARVVPVLEGLGGLPLSIDTAKAAVARRALELGAVLVNDITALRGDPDMAAVVADGDAFVCLMHMQGEPRTMQRAPLYADVVAEVGAVLHERAHAALAAGVPSVLLDPGLGFGKTAAHNLALLRALPQFTAGRLPVLVGASRKCLIDLLADVPRAAERDPADDEAALRVAGDLEMRALDQQLAEARLERGQRARRQRGGDAG